MPTYERIVHDLNLAFLVSVPGDYLSDSVIRVVEAWMRDNRFMIEVCVDARGHVIAWLAAQSDPEMSGWEFEKRMRKLAEFMKEELGGGEAQVTEQRGLESEETILCLKGASLVDVQVFMSELAQSYRHDEVTVLTCGFDGGDITINSCPALLLGFTGVAPAEVTEVALALADSIRLPEFYLAEGPFFAIWQREGVALDRDLPEPLD
jgi:hypothetical protein